MARFVTQKENTRRLGVLIVCVLIDLTCIVIGIFAKKNADDIQAGLEVRDNIVKLQGEVAELRGQLVDVRRMHTAFSEPIGYATTAHRTSDRFITGPVLHREVKKDMNRWTRELKETYGIDTFKMWSDKGGHTEGVLTLSRLFDVLKERIQWYEDEASRLEGEIVTFKTQEETEQKDMEEKDARVAREIEGDRGLVKDYKGSMKRFGAQEREHERDLLEAKISMRIKMEELTNIRNTNVRKRTQHELRKKELASRKNWIVHRRKEAAERKDPDGVVLVVNEKMQIAWIDIVHSDRLFKGTKFKVYSIEKGGVKIDKGVVEVIEVGKERSKVAIISQITEEPIQAEDRIYNEYFERDKPRFITFAGRFTGKLSNIEAARVVEEFGDTYQDKVDEHTNYVVLGEGYEDDPNFQIAAEFGIKLLLEKYLYDYLGVP